MSMNGDEIKGQHANNHVRIVLLSRARHHNVKANEKWERETVKFRIFVQEYIFDTNKYDLHDLMVRSPNRQNMFNWKEQIRIDAGGIRGERRNIDAIDYEINQYKIFIIT
jgi:hypothetical protein